LRHGIIQGFGARLQGFPVQGCGCRSQSSVLHFFLPAACHGENDADGGTLYMEQNTSLTMTLPLLSAPAATDMPVTVDNRTPAIAFADTPLSITAGSRVTQITINSTDTDGTGIIYLRYGTNQSRAILIKVGAPISGATPLTITPPIGIDVP